MTSPKSNRETYLASRVCAVDLQSPTYTPKRFLAKVREHLDCHTNTDLAVAIGLHPQSMYRFARRAQPITPAMMVRTADITGWSIAYIRELAGMPVLHEKFDA